MRFPSIATPVFIPVALAALLSFVAPVVSRAQSVGTQSITIGNAAGSNSVLLSASGAWTATANDSWLHMTTASGSGNTTVIFTYDASTGTGARSGSLTVAGVNVVVSQLGVNYAPVRVATSVVPSGLNVPNGLATDAAGNVYIADTANNAIKLWTASTGVVSTLVSSGLSSPNAVAVDSSGNVFIADSGNSKIKKWTASTQSVSDVLTATLPKGVAVDPAGNVYFTDKNTSSVKKWTASTNTVSTIASGLSSSLNLLARDFLGNLYFSDTNNGTVQMWTAATNVVSSISVPLGASPSGIAVDGSGNVIFADLSNSIIYQWSPSTGLTTTFKSSILATGLALDSTGNLFAANSASGLMRKITVANQVLATTTATVGSASGSSSVQLGYLPFSAGPAWSASTSDTWLHPTASGTGGGIVSFTYDTNNTGSTRAGTITFDSGLALSVTQAKSGYVASVGTATLVTESSGTGPYGIGLDSSGNVYFADRTSGVLKKWTQAFQTVSTVASGFGEPEQLVVDGAGVVYMADRDNGRIVRVTSQTITNLVAGLQLPVGIAVDPNGNVYFSDSNDHNLKAWNATTKQVTILISSGLTEPSALALDAQGNLYIADYTDANVKKWNVATQTLTTVISSGLIHPTGLAVDGSGNLYIADFSANSIYIWNPVSQQTATLISQISIHHLAVDPLGNVYYSDFGNNAVRAVLRAQVPNAALNEVATSGSDQTLPVLPLATPLTGVYIPTSDQSWLTPGTPANGNVPFSFAANPDASRTGHLTVVGNPIAITQAGVVAAITKNAGDSQTTGVGQTFSTALQVKLTNSGSAAVAGGHVTFAVVPGSGGSSGTFASSPTQPIVSLSDGTVTAPTLTANSTPGNFTVTATIGSLATTFNLTIGTLSQTITFGTPSDIALTATPALLSATASSSLPVSFASTTPSICTVSGTTITLVAVGQCSIQATQAGNGTYSAATPVTRSFQVTQGVQTITFGTLSNKALSAGSFTVSATASSNLTVAFASTTTGICTVSGTTVTLLAVGTCTIQAAQAGNANYAAATPVPQSFSVTTGTQTITFTQPPGQIVSPTAVALPATASSGLPVTLTSLTTSVCTVNGDNTVNMIAVGSCSLTASQAGDSNWNAANSVNRLFSVTQGSQTITFGTLSDRAFGSGTFTVSATASSGLAVSFSSTTTGICTVSSSTVTLVSVGQCSIKAQQGGTANYAAATPVTQSFNVTQGSQTITFGALTDQPLSTAPFTVSATSSSALAVSFNSQTTSICTVSGSMVTLVALGTCTIQAAQAGSTNWAAATPVNQSFNVTQGSQTITFGTLSNKAFGTSAFSVSATASSNLAVSFASTTTPVCTVSGGTVTLVAVGTCTIQATQSGNANYAAATPVSQNFQVTQGSQTITFGTLSSQALSVGTITVGATATSGLPVSFSSTTPSVCTVAGTTVTLVTTGSCTVQATQPGDSNWSAATPVNQSFSVTAGSQTITFGTLSNQAFGTAAFTVSATATSGLPVAFSSTTTGICTVSGSTVTLVAVGSCTVQATQAGNSNYAAATPVNQSFSVTKGNQTITFGTLSDRAFGSGTFTVSATASSSLVVSFSSLTTPVCTVSGTTVTLVSLGTCTIQATQSGNSNYNAATPANQGFQVTQGSQTITFGGLSDRALGSGTFTVSATASSSLAVSFTSLTAPVCTVSGSTVTLVAVGTCTIQASQPGNTNYAAATPANQGFNVTQGGQTITFGVLGNRALSAGSFSVSATATSGLAVSFVSTTAPVCTVSGSTVSLVATGTCTIRATQAGDSNYSIASPVDQSFQVTSGSQTITFGTLSSQVFGANPFTVSATATSGLAVTFSSLTTPVCTVSGSTVTLVGGGTCTIQAAQVGDGNYAAATPVPQSFQVTTASQTITFGTLSNQAYGITPFTISATATSSLPVTFTSTTTGICTVSASTVTLVAVGTCTIQASQSGNSNYAAATPVPQSFQVTTASQTITFGTLSNQILGAAPFTISATATSSLPVTFVSTTTGICTVSASTVTLVAVGTCTIQATQPGNSNYAAATPVPQSFQVTQPQYLLTTQVSPSSAAGSISPATGNMGGGSPIQVLATANPGYVFTGFSGGLTGTTNPQNLTLGGPATVTANFAPLPDLTIGLSHTASHFSQGQLGATYSIIVGNSGPGASTGTVTVTESLPMGLTLVAMSGPGWTCGTPNNANVCTRTDSLNAAGVYPTITVTVNVDTAAVTPLMNQAAVSGTGDYSLNNNGAQDSTIINAITSLTGQVSVKQAGFALNRSTGLWGTTMTVTNTSVATITGPIDVVLSNLSANATMANNTGLRNGSPYVVVAPGGLAPGASTSVLIQFQNPSNAAISFTSAAWSGAF